MPILDVDKVLRLRLEIDMASVENLAEGLSRVLDGERPPELVIAFDPAAG